MADTIRLGVLRGKNLHPRIMVDYSQLHRHGIEVEAIGYEEVPVDKYQWPIRNIRLIDHPRRIKPGDYDIIDVIGWEDYLGSATAIQAIDKSIILIDENRN